MDSDPESEDPEFDPPGLKFVVLHDPGDYPLAVNTVLNMGEVHYGLRLHSFYPGTQLLDQLTSQVHTVIQRRGRLALDPPCDRLHRYRRQGRRSP